MKVSLVPFDHVDSIWNEVKALLAPACAVTSGRFTPYDVYVMLQTQRAHLWIAFDDSGVVGCIVTTLSDYPSKRYLCLLFTAGKKISRWTPQMNDLLTRWAEDNGCDGIEGQGRPEWARMYRRFGCEPLAVCFERNV